MTWYVALDSKPVQLLLYYECNRALLNQSLIEMSGWLPQSNLRQYFLLFISFLRKKNIGHELISVAWLWLSTAKINARYLFYKKANNFIKGNSMQSETLWDPYFLLKPSSHYPAIKLRHSLLICMYIGKYYRTIL
jgi:hypothetical protein